MIANVAVKIRKIENHVLHVPPVVGGAERHNSRPEGNQLHFERSGRQGVKFNGSAVGQSSKKVCGHERWLAQSGADIINTERKERTDVSMLAQAVEF